MVRCETITNVPVLIKEFDDTVQHWDKGITRMQIDVEGYKKNSCGYVGLVNQGNTCYLNATVQQIFMITSLNYANKK